MSKSDTTTDLPALLRQRAQGPATDATHALMRQAADEIEVLRRELRRAGEWDEHHPAYIAGARDARRLMAWQTAPAHFDMSKAEGDGA